MSFIFRRAYNEPGTAEGLAVILSSLFPPGEEVIFLCIGTDKNILDCLGPLVGTMLREKAPPHVYIYGTLDSPLHARNLVLALKNIRQRHPDAYQVAIDASLGRAEEVGLVQIKMGSVIPGKALNKLLPAVGDIAITGTVAAHRGHNSFTRGSITPVYHLARTISVAISEAIFNGENLRST